MEKAKKRGTRKELSRKTKELKAKALLSDGYTNDEIIEKMAISRGVLARFRKELELEKLKAQEELNLKTQQEIVLSEKLDNMKELLPQAVAIVDKVELIEEKVESLDTDIEELVGLKIKTKKEALQYVRKAISTGELDADKLAFITLKDD